VVRVPNPKRKAGKLLPKKRRTNGANLILALPAQSFNKEKGGNGLFSVRILIVIDWRDLITSAKEGRGGARDLSSILWGSLRGRESQARFFVRRHRGRAKKKGAFDDLDGPGKGGGEKKWGPL